MPDARSLSIILNSLGKVNSATNLQRKWANKQGISQDDHLRQRMHQHTKRLHSHSCNAVADQRKNPCRQIIGWYGKDAHCAEGQEEHLKEQQTVAVLGRQHSVSQALLPPEEPCASPNT